MNTTLAEDRLVLGLDVGTQSLRAALVDLQGRTVAFGVAPYRHDLSSTDLGRAGPRPVVERGPNRGFQRPFRRRARRREQVAAIGLDCTACTVLACDLEGKPLRPALLWMDQRSFREADAISATGDPVLRYVSGRVSPEWMLPKALWLKTNEPETYRRAGRIVECTDWMMFRLTGQWTLSLNHVAVKWNYARPDGGWPLALLKAVGLDDLPGKWPDRIVPLGKGEARLDAAAALDLGLNAGTPVAQGGIDAYLGMLGLGATNAGDVAVIVGSSTCHLAQSREGVFGSGAAGCYPDATVEGLYTIEAGQTATGSILDWYRRHFAGREQAEADRRGVNVYQVLDEQAAEVSPRRRGAGRPRRLAGEPLSVQESAGPRGDRGALAGARPRAPLPRPLRGHGLRHPAHPRRRGRARPEGRARVPRRRRRPLGTLASDPRRPPQETRSPDPRKRVVRSARP